MIAVTSWTRVLAAMMAYFAIHKIWTSNPAVVTYATPTSATSIAVLPLANDSGDATATFEWLDRAWNNRDAGIHYLLFDPFILRYEDDPRFASFCRKVGLPAPGGATAHRST